jgi:drug/metabolite transporter (DMT)-like permease
MTNRPASPVADFGSFLEDRRRALVLFGAAIALLATMDMTVKLASTQLSTTQIVWGRYITQCFAIVLIAGRANLATCFRSRALGLHVIRALLLFIANFAFMAALRYLPLAEANVIGFASPLLLTALASVLLSEPVSAHRWIAVSAGFAGVLIVMRPGTELFKWAALLPLLMAFASALYHALTPIVARVEDPAVSIYFLGIFGAVAMSLVVPWFWVAPDMLGWFMLLVIGVLGTAGHLLIVRAFAHAAASVLAPFFYIHLIWATAYGWLIFGNLPNLATLIGGSLIIASGVYIYRTR